MKYLPLVLLLLCCINGINLAIKEGKSTPYADSPYQLHTVFLTFIAGFFYATAFIILISAIIAGFYFSYEVAIQ